MQTITLSAHFDGQQIRLDEPYELAAGSQLFITIVPATTADDDAWDEQISHDVAAGKLDTLAEEARQDLRTGRTTPRR